jgi:hypothetical protein
MGPTSTAEKLVLAVGLEHLRILHARGSVQYTPGKTKRLSMKSHQTEQSAASNPYQHTSSLVVYDQYITPNPDWLILIQEQSTQESGSTKQWPEHKRRRRGQRRAQKRHQTHSKEQQFERRPIHHQIDQICTSMNAFSNRIVRCTKSGINAFSDCPLRKQTTGLSSRPQTGRAGIHRGLCKRSHLFPSLSCDQHVAA